jgi:CheY-like chemotaxis protein
MDQQKNTEKMAALGRLARGLVHDFNNSLGSILGYAEFLVTDLDPHSEQHVFATNIRQAGYQMQELLDQIRALAQEHRPGKDVPLNMINVIKNHIDHLKDSLPKEQTIHLQTELEGAMLAIPPHQCRILLGNVVRNALESLNNGPGHITIAISRYLTSETQPPYEQSRIILPPPSSNTAPIITIDIADTGCGMDDITLNLCCEPYFTTKPAGDSHGMGLPIVQGIVHYLGGGMSIATSPGKGTSVTLTIPVQSLHETVVPMAPHDATRNILFIEDRDMVKHTVETMLLRAGHSVQSFSSAFEGLDHLRENPDRFDLIITDYSMPDINGDEMITEIRADFPDMPIIMMSGDQDNLRDTLNSSQHTDIHVLPKPVLAEDLRRVIKAATN